MFTLLLLDIDRDILSNAPVTRNYNSDFKEAVGSLMVMVSEREQLETKIAKQKKKVAALYELVQTDEGSAALSGLVEGLTDACRVVFRATEKPLDASEVRDRVQALGLPPQANLLASVHTTIKRMKDSGEIKEMTVQSSRGLGPQPAGYVWVGGQRSLNAYADIFKSGDISAAMREAVGRNTPPKAPVPPGVRWPKK